MAEQLRRTKTGIGRLDKALNGGFPFGNVVLVSGGAGTGKSTFAMQFLINGATLFGEKGLYISTEQSKEELMKTAASYGWNIENLELNNKLKIVYFDVIET
ncbi:MAG: ATPase, partial [Candidatus Diapherotrites archaeon]|nr:ATPase [Candidatus Diapherotrites archaeon]